MRSIDDLEKENAEGRITLKGEEFWPEHFAMNTTIDQSLEDLWQVIIAENKGAILKTWEQNYPHGPSIEQLWDDGTNASYHRMNPGEYTIGDEILSYDAARLLRTDTGRNDHLMEPIGTQTISILDANGVRLVLRKENGQGAWMITLNGKEVDPESQEASTIVTHLNALSEKLLTQEAARLAEQARGITPAMQRQAEQHQRVQELMKRKLPDNIVSGNTTWPRRTT